MCLERSLRNLRCCTTEYEVVRGYGLQIIRVVGRVSKGTAVNETFHFREHSCHLVPTSELGEKRPSVFPIVGLPSTLCEDIVGGCDRLRSS